MSILRQKMSQYLMCLFVAHQKAVIIPMQEETSLGPIEHQAVVSSVQNSSKKKGEKISNMALGNTTPSIVRALSLESLKDPTSSLVRVQ